jgi:hypothetical protein
VFEEEIATGAALVRSGVGMSMLKKALSDTHSASFNAGKWIEQTRFGITDKVAEGEESARNTLELALRVIQTRIPVSPAAAEEAEEQFRQLEQAAPSAKRAAEESDGS